MQNDNLPFKITACIINGLKFHIMDKVINLFDDKYYIFIWLSSKLSATFLIACLVSSVKFEYN